MRAARGLCRVSAMLLRLVIPQQKVLDIRRPNRQDEHKITSLKPKHKVDRTE